MNARFLLCGLLASALHFQLSAADWPSWRGTSFDNTTPETDFPLSWNKTENVAWRTPLPEPGNSSPIVSGDRIFVTQALEDGKRRSLLAFDRRNGKVLWQQTVAYDHEDPRHQTNPHCAASPVTDGNRVVVSFGSAGIVAYDLAGKQLWHTDLGKQVHTWGQGSSPVLHGDLCLVFHGPGEFSALHALDKRTGKKLWSVPLPETHPPERFDGFAGKTDGMIGSFSTPIVVRAANRDEVVLSLPNQLRAFAANDGKPLWHSEGLNPLIYTSPTYGEGRIVAMGGFFGGTIFVKPGGSGDVTATHRTFHEQRSKRHRIGSPILKDGHIYVCNTIGIAECIEAATGKPVWEERLKATGADGEAWASFVLSGDRLYLINRSGDTFILRAAPKFEVLAVNSIGEISNSTPAFSRKEIILRTHAALWCVREGAKLASAQ